MAGWMKPSDPVEIGKAYWDYNLQVSIVLGVMGTYDHGTVWYDTTGGMFDATRLAVRNPYDGKPAVPSAETQAKADAYFAAKAQS